MATPHPALAPLDAAIQAGNYGPVRSLLVQRGDTLLHEAYFRGANAQELHLLNSVTKSIGAVLVGMAVRRGLLDVDAPLSELLPQYDWNSPALRDKRELTLAHVLSMRHGLRWDEWSTSFLDPRNSAVQMFASEDWYGFTLQRERDAGAGTRFTYSTGVSTLMSGVLRRATGRSVEDLFVHWLASPLGIQAHHWELWSPQGRGHGLTRFPNGDVPLGVGLWLRPRDLVRIGQLHLQGGVWQGRRLLDQEWIDASWTRHSRSGNDPYFRESPERTGYGYQWWFLQLLDARARRIDCWYAQGAGRQYLFVCPLLDLIVVSTGDAYDYSGPGVISLMREHVLPAFDPPVRAHLSGTYHDPANSGQGVMIEVSEDDGRVVLGWYTYDGGSQRWYVGSGRIDGERVQFDDIHRTTGGGFLSGPPPTLIRSGDGRLQWSDCHHATLSFRLDGEQGERALTRLTGTCPE